MKKLFLFLAFCTGDSSVCASEQIPHEEALMISIEKDPAIAALETTDLTITSTAKPDPAINLPTSIEISLKFAATEKKPEPHSVDLVLSKSTLATLSNYGAQTITWAYEQAKDFVHKAAVFTAESTKRD